MKRGGGTAGRPFGDWSIEQLEEHVRKVTDLSDLKALRSELGFRKSKRASELDSLIARLIREWTGSYDPNAEYPGSAR